MRRTKTGSVQRYVVGLLVVAAIVAFYKRMPVNPTTVGFTLLVAVLLASAYWGFRVAVVLSIVATAALNFFFFPPFGTFTIADPQNWIALIAFLITALVASNLAERARREAEAANQQRRDVEHLYTLSQQLLTVENIPALMNAIPQFISDAFGLEGAAIITPARPTVYRSNPDIKFDSGALMAAAARGEVTTAEREMYIPVRVGVKSVGGIALIGGPVSRQTADAIGGLVGTAIERTRAVEELAATQAARENERLRSALLDSVTHEFRTPLTGIKASITGLMSSPDLDDAQRNELMAIIDEEADRLNRLVGEAAEMAQLDAHGVKLERRSIRLGDVIDTVLSELRDRLEGHEVQVTIDNVPSVNADFERLREVVSHLVQNAAKYSAAGTPIHITVEVKDGYVVTSIADRGPGIDTLEQSLIFDKFYRGARERYAAPGTGMGLAIAKSLVEAHGGTIGVISQVGHGSVFWFRLPVAEGRPGTAAQNVLTPRRFTTE